MTAAGVVALALCVGMLGTSVAAVRALAEAKRADGEAAKAVEAAAVARAEAERAERQLDRAERLVYASQIAKADAEFKIGDLENAEKLLRQTRWDLRGWEYDYLSSLLHHRHVTIARNTHDIVTVGFSIDGSEVFSVDQRGAKRSWLLSSGVELFNSNDREIIFKSGNFSGDGKFEFRVRNGVSIQIRDLAASNRLQTFRGHSGPLTSYSYSPNGNCMVTAGNDNTIKVWDIATLSNMGAILHVSAATFNSDGRRLAYVADNALVKVVDTKTSLELVNFKAHARPVRSVRFSPDGTQLATAGDDCTIKLWDATSGRELASMLGHTGFITGVTFDADGSRLLSASDDHTVKSWDAASGRELFTLDGHKFGVNCAMFSPDGNHVVSASDDNTGKVWDLHVKQHRTLQGHMGGLSCVAFSNGGKQIISASYDKTIKRWEVTSGVELESFVSLKLPATSIVYSLDGTRLITTCGDNSAKLWDTATGQELLSFDGVTGSGFDANLQLVAYNADGYGIVGFDENARMTSIYQHIESPDSVISIGSGRIAESLAVTSSGNEVIVRTESGHEAAMLQMAIGALCLLQFDDLPSVPPPAAAPASPLAPVSPPLPPSTQGSTSRIEIPYLTAIQVWSLTTGKLLRGEPIPPDLTFVNRADLPDGKREVFIEGGKIVVRDKAKYAAFQAEMARRLAEYAMPKPAWHARSFDEAPAAQDWFAARFHLRYLRKIQGDADLGVRWRAARLPA